MRGTARACLAVALAAASCHAETFFVDKFDDLSKWTPSKAKEEMGAFGHGAGKWSGDEKVQTGMTTPDDMKFYAASAKLSKPTTTRGKELVVQFSVKHEEHKYAFCGGGYIKLLPKSLDQEKFSGDSPYFVMFGPDMCGYDTSLIHLIFSYKGDNLLKTDKIDLDYAEKNEFTHLYTLHLFPNDTYAVYFDMEPKANGSLLEQWPYPQPTMEDPEDTKPEDWVDERKIDDPDDKKPDGYDDIPKEIADPEATKPDDWDDEDDGEWEAPRMPNPEYKGAWSPKRIDNPAYKGEWKPREIPNPKYEAGVQLGAFDDIGAVGFELWIVNNGTVFDNVVVTDSLAEAFKLAEETWKPFVEKEKEAKEAWDKEHPSTDEYAGGEEDEDYEGEEEEDAFGGMEEGEGEGDGKDEL